MQGSTLFVSPCCIILLETYRECIVMYYVFMKCLNYSGPTPSVTKQKTKMLIYDVMSFRFKSH